MPAPSSRAIGFAPLNLIELFTRSLSLTVRLFGNVMSGVFVISIVLSLVGLLVPVPLMALELLTGSPVGDVLLQTQHAQCRAALPRAVEGRGEDIGHHLLRRHGLAALNAQDAAQRLVAAASLVVLQAPVATIQPGIDLRVEVAAMEAGFEAGGLEAGKVGHGGIVRLVCCGLSRLATSARR